MTSDSETITACRSCGQPDLREVLDLGATPLANRLLSEDQLDQIEPRYPLVLAFCPSCTLLQITETVSPEVLFGEYFYRSSFSDQLLVHSKEHVEELLRTRSLGPESFVVEIASNDGYLLKNFVAAGVPVLGIEPARNIAKIAEEEEGIPTRCAFFGSALAETLKGEGIAADVILGNNVLAHVSDLNGFVAGVQTLLTSDGIAEFEFPYVGPFVEHVEFDTIYHEHLCYFSAHAVAKLFERHGLVLADVRTLPIHGGSLRVTAAREPGPGQERVEALLSQEREKGLDGFGFYEDFGARVLRLKGELLETLERLKGQGARLVGYGASAKGSTLLNCFGIGKETLDYVVDRSTLKQGRFTPGTQLPIHDPVRLLEDRPDYALLLTWNFAEEILRQQKEYTSGGGRFIIPVPTVRLEPATS